GWAAPWSGMRGWRTPPPGRWRLRKGEQVSKPPAAAGGIRRAAMRETDASVTIDGHPVNLVPLPGLEDYGGDDAHGGDEVDGGRVGPSGGRADGARDGGWRSRLADVLEFARRQLDGESEVDQFGF